MHIIEYLIQCHIRTRNHTLIRLNHSIDCSNPLFIRVFFTLSFDFKMSSNTTENASGRDL